MDVGDDFGLRGTLVELCEGGVEPIDLFLRNTTPTLFNLFTALLKKIVFKMQFDIEC